VGIASSRFAIEKELRCAMFDISTPCSWEVNCGYDECM
jgi:hypothetical protein